MKTLAEKIEVMQAALDGKQIQKIYRDEWLDIMDCQWDWVNCDYRIKQEPMELMIDIYSNDHFEVSSDKNVILYKGTPIIRRIKMREVTE